MYMAVVVALVNLAGSMITFENRTYPWPDLATCEAVLKVRLEEMARERQFPRRVTKAECEKLPG